MKRLLYIIVCIILISLVVYYIPNRATATAEKQLDTIFATENGDTMFFVVNANKDTINWYGYSKGVWMSKQKYEETKKMVDTLINLGYKKGQLIDY